MGFLIAIALFIILILKFRKRESDENIINTDSEDFNYSDFDYINQKIQYKKNDIYIYNEELLKYSSIELNNNINQNENILNENNLYFKKLTIISKYFINIFNIQKEDSNITYYAYVSIIDIKKNN